MLPEKKKNLIMLGIGLILLIIIVLSVAGISNWIKNRSKEESVRNDSYPKTYSYYGVYKDTENVYRINGISKDDEIYLGIRTFFEISDIKTSDNRIKFYSDAVNELRYNKKENSFFQYEINNYYSNDYKGLLTDDKIIYVGNNEILYTNYNSTEKIKVSDNVIDQNILVNNERIIYKKADGIYKYDFKKETRMLNIPTDDIIILAESDNYLYCQISSKLVIYSIESQNEISILEEVKDSSFINAKNEEFLYQDTENVLRKYSMKSGNTINFEFPLEGKIINSYNINESLLYVTLESENKNKNYILNTEEKSIVQELKNDYLFIAEVK